MNYLTSKGAPLDTVDVYGLTPLLHCVKRNLLDCAEVLLKAGTNANFLSPNIGESALLLAAFQAEKDPVQSMKTIKLLLKYGADVNLESNNGLTPLTMCCRLASCVSIIRLLLQHGANADIAWHVETGEIVTPIVVACRCDIRIVELLLQAGADPNQRTEECSVLECSTRTEVAQEPTTHLLRKCGADPNPPAGMLVPVHRPLVDAVIHQDRARVQRLLQYGAKKPLLNADKHILLKLALQPIRKDDMLPLLAFPGCGLLNVVIVKPKRLREEEMLVDFTFTFCTQCRGVKNHEDLMVCSGRRIVAYCNAECQREHWKKHKKICKQKQVNDELARKTDNCI